MADIYKLQYNGMTLAYPGWNGYVSWENAEVAYNLYLQQQIGGTISADKLSGMNGEIVTLGNTPDAGYQFNSYGITGAELSGNQFAFNGSDVSAQANFEEAVYTLTLQTDGHGTIAATKTTGHAGDTVTLSNTYNTYYRFNNYTVTGGTINGSTFTFGNEDATAKANFSANKFTATGTFNSITNTGTDYKYYKVYFYAKVNGVTGTIPSNFRSSTTSYWSAYGRSSDPKVNSTSTASWNPNGTISGYSFTGKFVHKAVNEYYTANEIGGSLRTSKNANFGTWKWTTAASGKYNRVYTITGSGTTNVTGVPYYSAYMYKGSTFGCNLCTAVTTNAWTASGYLP